MKDRERTQAIEESTMHQFILINASSVAALLDRFKASRSQAMCGIGIHALEIRMNR
jgi:hypothetical protein